MVPLPFRAETLISQPLQQIAAVLSAFVLRCLGQPAFAQETTLLIGHSILEVEQTCSGLRIFVGIFALACGYLIAFRREAWEAALLLVSAIPVALLANALRIVVTAILFQHFTEEAAHTFSHDVAGWLMIPLAAVLLGCVQWYLNCLMRDMAVGDVSDVVRRSDTVLA
jgi:exosortase